jgi:hypothetical protein
MYSILRIIAFVIPIAAILTAEAVAQPFSAGMSADLDGDGKAERIEVDAGRDPVLEVRRVGKPVWRGIPAAWRPWKLAIGDVDGDGKPEVALGVFKSTKFFTRPHNCLFLYNWNVNALEPKWLGSSLGRPFTDFAFADISSMPGNELIAIEMTLEGRKTLAIYRWNSFGFTLERQEGLWNSAEIVGVGNGRVEIMADDRPFQINME